MKARPLRLGSAEARSNLVRRIKRSVDVTEVGAGKHELRNRTLVKDD